MTELEAARDPVHAANTMGWQVGRPHLHDERGCWGRTRRPSGLDPEKVAEARALVARIDALPDDEANSAIATDEAQAALDLMARANASAPSVGLVEVPAHAEEADAA